MPVSSCTKYSKSLNKKFTHETLVDKSLQNSKKVLLSVQLALTLYHASTVKIVYLKNLEIHMMYNNAVLFQNMFM